MICVTQGGYFINSYANNMVINALETESINEC